MALTGAEMRALEQAAIRSGRVSGLDLMEGAGRCVVEAIQAEWPVLAERAALEDGVERGPAPGPPRYLEQEEGPRAVVLCGPGNNGGDGFVVARLLAERGWKVQVHLFGDAARFSADARACYSRWAAIGTVLPFPDERPDPWGADLIVDALFGIGLTRVMSDDLSAALMTCLPESDLRPVGQGPYVVSVDVPSGLNADTGDLMPVAVDPDLTVTFHALKAGHVRGRGPEFCGKLVVADIGL